MTRWQHADSAVKEQRGCLELFFRCQVGYPGGRVRWSDSCSLLRVPPGVCEAGRAVTLWPPGAQPALPERCCSLLLPSLGRVWRRGSLLLQEVRVMEQSLLCAYNWVERSAYLGIQSVGGCLSHLSPFWLIMWMFLNLFGTQVECCLLGSLGNPNKG